MVEGAEDARDRSLRLNRLIGSFGVAPVLEALEPLGVGEEELGRMQSGLEPLDDGVMGLLGEMSSMLGAGVLDNNKLTHGVPRGLPRPPGGCGPGVRCGPVRPWVAAARW